MNQLETLETIVAEAQTQVPFQNMRDLWWLKNDAHRIPEGFGGSCVWQTAHVAQAIRQRIGDLSVQAFNRTGLRDESHVIGVVQSDAGEHAFETTQLLRTLADLTKIHAQGQLYVPTYNSQKSKMVYRHFQMLPNGTLVLTSKTYGGSTDPDSLGMINLATPVHCLDNETRFNETLARHPQAGLFYHILDHSGQKHFAILPIEDAARKILIGTSGTQKITEDDPGFMDRMDYLADLTGQTGKQLQELFHQSRDLYHEIHGV